MRGLVQCDGRCKFVLCTQQECPRGCFFQKITAALHPNPHFHRLRWASGPAIDRPRSTMHALRVCRTGSDPLSTASDMLPDSAFYRVLHVREDGKWRMALSREWDAAEN